MTADKSTDSEHTNIYLRRQLHIMAMLQEWADGESVYTTEGLVYSLKNRFSEWTVTTCGCSHFKIYHQQRFDSEGNPTYRPCELDGCKCTNFIPSWEEE